METDTLMLRGIPPRLKGKIKRATEEDETSMNDVLVGILCAAYDIPFEPTGLRRMKVGKSPKVLLEIPAALKLRIKLDAAETNDSQTNVAMRIISEAFGVPFRPTGRWTKTRTAAAA